MRLQVAFALTEQLVRAAASGLSAPIDPWGRVLSMSEFYADGDRTMTAQLPMGRIPTLYARTGDWFSWLCVGGLAVMLVIAMTSAAERSVVQLMTRQLFVFGRGK